MTVALYANARCAARRPLLALSGHSARQSECPLLTQSGHSCPWVPTTVYDPAPIQPVAGGKTRISCKGAEARLETPVPSLSNLKMRLMDTRGAEIPGMLYGKVLGSAAQTDESVAIRFISSLDAEDPHGQTSA